jgi:hypothetical protein
MSVLLHSESGQSVSLATRSRRELLNVDVTPEEDATLEEVPYVVSPTVIVMNVFFYLVKRDPMFRL